MVHLDIRIESLVYNQNFYGGAGMVDGGSQ